MPELPARSPVESLQAGVRQRQLSPQAVPAWWRLRCALVGSVVAALLGWIPGWGGNLLVVASGGAAVVCALHAVLLETRVRRFWTAVLGVGAVGLVLSGPSELARVLVSTLLVLFLVFRRYHIFRRLLSRQRAWLFLGAVTALVMLTLTPPAAESSTWVGGLLRQLRATVRFALVLFWLVAAAWLFLGAQLHFLRLRPKLAVVTLLVAVVPFLLALTLSVVAIFGFLGGSRASQGKAIIDEWMEMVAQDELAGSGSFENAFGEGLGPPPTWKEGFDRALRQTRWDPLPASILLERDDELWLLRLAESEDGPVARRGYRFSARTAQKLADQLRCEVGFLLDREDELEISLGGEGGTRAPSGPLWARPSAAADSTSSDWWHTWLPFGGIPVESYDAAGTLARGQTILVLKARPVDLIEEIAPRDNEIHQAIAVALALVAGLFLILQLLALGFGARIVAGLTSAVKELHQGTEKLARGDLETWIELPNEDEFGDLADSFNEMTQALRVGQDQALQRELLEQEVLMARSIQERLLPSDMPRIPGFEVSASSDPSRQVGGDYFDFVELGDGRWGFAVGDVTGKGVPAALLMSNVQASLHGQAMHPGSVADTVQRMNRLLSRSTDQHMFVTFFYGVLDPGSGEVLCTNAGHEPPLLLRRDGSLERIRSGGLVLGMLDDQAYAEQRFTMDPGDTLVLFTDGVTEATGPDQADPEDEDFDEEDVSFFEEERLIEVVRSAHGRSADEMRRMILREVRQFTAGKAPSDDVTLLVLRRSSVAA